MIVSHLTAFIQDRRTLLDSATLCSRLSIQYTVSRRLTQSRSRRGSTILLGNIVSVTGKPRLWKSNGDRKSTRLNSSHSQISYAVFCLKKKKKKKKVKAESYINTNKV